MEWVSVLVVCLLHLFIIRTEGYPQGAPSSACTFMTPSHYPASFQNSQSPFVIYTSSNTYVPEQNIQGIGFKLYLYIFFSLLIYYPRYN